MCQSLYLPILLFLLCLCIVHIIQLSMYNLLAAPQEPLFGIRTVLREIIVTKNRHPCIVRNAFSQILRQGGGKYVTKLGSHVYTLSDWVTISHLVWAGKSLLDKAIVWGRYHKKQPDFSFTTYLRVLKRGGFLKDKHKQFCTLFLGCFLRYKII